MKVLGCNLHDLLPEVNAFPEIVEQTMFLLSLKQSPISRKITQPPHVGERARWRDHGYNVTVMNKTIGVRNWKSVYKNVIADSRRSIRIQSLHFEFL